MRKPKTNPRSDDKRLTNVELELMTILWTLGEGNVTQVIAALPAERALAYTSVSTILRILEGKGFVAARREGRGHLYKPTISKNEYEARAVKDVVTACSRACRWPWCANCSTTCDERRRRARVAQARRQLKDRK